MHLEKQIEDVYGLPNAHCEHLDIPVNDVIKVTAGGRWFALKVYHKRRTREEVQWEADLVAHLMKHDAPVAGLVRGQDGYVESCTINGQERIAMLFEWALGEKPVAEHDTYALLGNAAARIHKAADSFKPSWMRDDYNVAVLIDEQLERMKDLLLKAGQWQRMTELTERLKGYIDKPELDRGICHMDLTLDNVHRKGGSLTVFDFDSSGLSWRALEPHGILKLSRNYFKDWLKGYRAIRDFSEADEKAVAAFGIIGELRVVAWKLGVAKSSRGRPLLTVADLPAVVDAWLAWEKKYVNAW